MSGRRPGPGTRYFRFLAGIAAVCLALAALAWLPTSRSGGDRAVAAMLAGLAISATASAVGALPLVWEAGNREPHLAASAALASIGLRLLIAVALGAAAVASGRFPLRPLLLWLAGSYLALLFVDTLFALSAFRARRATEK